MEGGKVKLNEELSFKCKVKQLGCLLENGNNTSINSVPETLQFL